MMPLMAIATRTQRRMPRTRSASGLFCTRCLISEILVVRVIFCGILSRHAYQTFALSLHPFVGLDSSQRAAGIFTAGSRESGSEDYDRTLRRQETARRPAFDHANRPARPEASSDCEFSWQRTGLSG